MFSSVLHPPGCFMTELSVKCQHMPTRFQVYLLFFCVWHINTPLCECLDVCTTSCTSSFVCVECLKAHQTFSTFKRDMHYFQCHLPLLPWHPEAAWRLVIDALAVSWLTWQGKWRVTPKPYASDDRASWMTRHFLYSLWHIHTCTFFKSIAHV